MSYLTLRRFVGCIAVLLPVALVLANVFFHKQFSIRQDWPDSASQYYYTGLRDVFVGSLVVLGVFLLAYEGYDRADFWITFFAGVCAIGVALFPTKPTCPNSQPNCLSDNQKLVGNVHSGFAIFLLVFMAAMAWRFAKSSNEKTQGSALRLRKFFGLANDWTSAGSPAYATARKKRRNWVFRISGAITLACAVLFVLAAWTSWFRSIQNAMPFLYLVEATAIFAFGTAWFVKGRTFLAILLAAGRRLPVDPSPTAAAGQLTSAEADDAAEELRSRLAAGTSTMRAARELSIRRRQVSELAASMT